MSHPHPAIPALAIQKVRPIAADMVTLLEGVDRDAAVGSVKRIPEVPTNVLHREVDMEDW